jgi:hypothetical protein
MCTAVIGAACGGTPASAGMGNSATGCAVPSQFLSHNTLTSRACELVAETSSSSLAPRLNTEKNTRARSPTSQRPSAGRSTCTLRSNIAPASTLVPRVFNDLFGEDRSKDEEHHLDWNVSVRSHTVGIPRCAAKYDRFSGTVTISQTMPAQYTHVVDCATAGRSIFTSCASDDLRR